MQRIKEKDRFSIIVLFTLKSTMFNIIIRAFVRDLANANVKLKITRTIIIINRSLRITYNLVKKI